METDTDLPPGAHYTPSLEVQVLTLISDDDNIFGALFSESRTTSFKEPVRSETVYIDSKYDDDALDLAKSI